MHTVPAESSWHRASLFLQVIALFGIPTAGGVALVFSLQLTKIIYGQANPFLFVAEIGSVAVTIALLFMLRACLALSSAPRGFYRNVLDFLAMARWHPATKAALTGLIVLPQVWYFWRDHYWLIDMRHAMGHGSLRLSIVQTGLDDIVVIWQLALTGGVPLLFVLHMWTRWKPKSRILPWLVLPLLFLGTAVAVVIIVAAVHH